MSEYAYLSSDELMHYGVIGMKWGVRKAEYDANVSRERNRKDVRKALNKTAHKIAKWQYKQSKAQDKIGKIKSKRPKSKKLQKLNVKAKGYQERINYGNKITNKVMKDFKSKGYSINSKPVQYYVGSGKQVAAHLAVDYFTGIPGLVGAHYARMNPEYFNMKTNGKRYIVSDKRR